MKGKIVYTSRGRTFFLEGKEVTQEEFDASITDKPMGVGPIMVEQDRSNKPRFSHSLACHPKQVKKFAEDSRKRGVPTDFLPDGQPGFTSRAHQKAYCKAYNFVNHDGGYGD